LEAGLPQPRESLPDNSSFHFEDDMQIDSSSAHSPDADTESGTEDFCEEEIAVSIAAHSTGENEANASGSERASTSDPIPNIPLADVHLLRQLLRQLWRKRQLRKAFRRCD
jgi:hypothetical protein